MLKIVVAHVRYARYALSALSTVAFSIKIGN